MLCKLKHLRSGSVKCFKYLNSKLAGDIKLKLGYMAFLKCFSIHKLKKQTLFENWKKKTLKLLYHTEIIVRTRGHWAMVSKT